MYVVFCPDAPQYEGTFSTHDGAHLYATALSKLYACHILDARTYDLIKRYPRN